MILNNLKSPVILDAMDLEIRSMQKSKADFEAQSAAVSDLSRKAFDDVCSTLSALEVARQWMLDQKVTSISHVGCFGDPEWFTKSMKVLIRSGASVHSTKDGERRELKRSQWVAVAKMRRGFCSREVIQPEIMWVGSGGYWQSTSVSNVESINHV